MPAIIEGSRLIVRPTQEADVAYVVTAEREAENARYVGQWSAEEHIHALTQPDILHVLIQEQASRRSVGYVVMAGIKNPNHSIEFRRLVITDKGKGYGRETLQLIKKLAFQQLNAHRLWLDVRVDNLRAQRLYLSEGFVQEGILRECVLFNGGYESLIIMSMLKNEYSAC